MKHSFSKKLISFILVFLMVVSMMPAITLAVTAAEGEVSQAETSDESEIQATKQEGYILVTDVSNLAVGDKIIIAAAGYDFAISTNQKTNNREHVAITKNAEKNSVLFNSDSTVQVLTLAAGTKDGTFAFYTGSGYLYAASSSDNNMKTQTTLNDNGSWTIAIASDGVATVLAQGTNTRNYMRYNSGNSLFSCYASDSQKAISIYKCCTHTNTEGIGEPSEATCTESGMTAGKKCLDCGALLEAQAEIEPLGHIDEDNNSICDRVGCGVSLCEEHIYVDGDVLVEGDCTTNRVVAQVCKNCGQPTTDKEITAPGHTEEIDAARDATCTEAGLTEGKHCSVCSLVLIEQTVTAPKGHTYVDGVCTTCGDKAGTFKKVTSAPKDWSGTYIIVYEAGSLVFDGSLSELDVASNNQAVTIAGDTIETSLAYAFTVRAVEGGYSIMSSTGIYIGKTASGSNGINEKDTDSYVNTFALNSDGSANIISESGLVIRYNKSSGDERFRFYGADKQQPVALYKLDEGSAPAAEFGGFGVTLNKGVTVKVQLDVSAEWLADNAGAYVIFKNGINDTRFDAVSGSHVYSITLTPAAINNDLTFELCSADGGTVAFTRDVSFKAYAAKITGEGVTADSLGLSDERYSALCELITAINNYASAADGTLEGTLTETFDGVDAPLLNDTVGSFGSVSATLSGQVDIKLNVNASDAVSGYTLTVKLGDRTIVDQKPFTDHITSNNQVVIKGLYAANFDDVITLTLSDASGEVAGMSFTFNAYLKALYEGSSDAGLKNLVAATYQYGKAAVNYDVTK